jgi:hypothetical protein
VTKKRGWSPRAQPGRRATSANAPLVKRLWAAFPSFGVAHGSFRHTARLDVTRNVPTHTLSRPSRVDRLGPDGAWARSGAARIPELRGRAPTREQTTSAELTSGAQRQSQVQSTCWTPPWKPSSTHTNEAHSFIVADVREDEIQETSACKCLVFDGACRG